MSKLNLKTVKAYHIRENFHEIYKEENREGFEKSSRNGISERPITGLKS